MLILNQVQVDTATYYFSELKKKKIPNGHLSEQCLFREVSFTET